MIANIQGVMAESPTLLGSYLKLWRPFAKSSLSPVEQQVVLLAAAFENDCDYCVPAHTGLARKLGVDEPRSLGGVEPGEGQMGNVG